MARNPVEIAEMLLRAADALTGLTELERRYGLRDSERVASLKNSIVDRMAELLAAPYVEPQKRIVPRSYIYRAYTPSTLQNLRKTRPAIARALDEIAHLSSPIQVRIIATLLNSLPPSYRSKILSMELPA
jgi:hypothetical protein